ncbi:MAG: choice-of-anchor E domain-containing protein [Caldilineaceae bacterium]
MNVFLRHHYFYVSLAIFLLYLLSPNAVFAEEIVYTDEVPLQRTSWQKTLTVPLFDPKVGILTEIKFVLVGHVNGSALLENLDAEAAFVTAESVANIRLDRPNGTQITGASPTASREVFLTAFDNTIDFGGTSGVSIENIVGIDVSDETSFTDSETLALFTGPGTIELGISTKGRSRATGAGNLALSFNTLASAAVTVTYSIAHPAIALEKSTNGTDADQLPGPHIYQGEPVTWTYLVTNIGEVPLVDINLVDDQEGPITANCPQNILAINESMTCTVTGIAQRGQYTILQLSLARFPVICQANREWPQRRILATTWGLVSRQLTWKN